MDLELLKRELEEAAQSEKSQDQFWKAKDGVNVIRILPPPEGSQLFYRNVGVHYRLLGVRVAFCPRITFSKPCPVCEYVDCIKDSDNPIKVEVARRLFPVSRYLMNVYLLDEKRIVPYLAPKTVRTGLLRIMLDPDWGDITRLDTGRNVVIEKIIPSSGTLKVMYDVRTKPNVSAVPVSMSDIPKFESIIDSRMLSYEELENHFRGDTKDDEELIRRYYEEFSGRSPVSSSSEAVSEEALVGKISSVLAGTMRQKTESLTKSQSEDDAILAQVKKLLESQK